MTSSSHDELTTPKSRGKTTTFLRVIVFAGLVIAGTVVYWKYGDAVNFERLATHEARLREYQQQRPVLVYAAAFLIYVLVTGLSLPGAVVLSLSYAWFFGFWRGLVLISFASTAGATVAFLLSRFLFREAVQSRFGDRLQNLNAAFEREGAFYLFTLRLMPSIPFFLINVLMGLTPIHTRTYWWVSQLGMLPGTGVYVFAGSQIPDLQTFSEQGVRGIFSPGLLVAFVALAVLPLLIKRLLAKKDAGQKTDQANS